MTKKKTPTASEMAERRWANVSPEERSAIMTRASRLGVAVRQAKARQRRKLQAIDNDDEESA